MVQIITDSSTLITVAEGKEMGIDVLPLCVNIMDEDYRDLQVDMDDFYGKTEKMLCAKQRWMDLVRVYRLQIAHHSGIIDEHWLQCLRIAAKLKEKQAMAKAKKKTQPVSLPMLPLRGLMVFPHMYDLFDNLNLY